MHRRHLWVSNHGERRQGGCIFPEAEGSRPADARRRGLNGTHQMQFCTPCSHTCRHCHSKHTGAMCLDHLRVHIAAATCVPDTSTDTNESVEKILESCWLSVGSAGSGRPLIVPHPMSGKKRTRSVDSTRSLLMPLLQPFSSQLLRFWQVISECGVYTHLSAHSYSPWSTRAPPWQFRP